jgi:4-alpha-glucanotransferase
VLCEDGTQRTGETAFAPLPLLARAEGDERSGRRKERRRLALAGVPVGYHRLELEPLGAGTTLVVTPGRCFLPTVDEGRGLGGLAVQLYLLRSETNLGIGDFGDLATLGAELERRPCDVVGLNPLHAPFPDDPEHASPYSPASRLLLSPLYIDVAAAREVRESPAAGAMLADPELAAEAAACRASDTVEYGRVAALKARILDRAFADWRGTGMEAGELAAFRAAQGPSFERHCLYFALRAHLLATGSACGDWHGWPQAYQDPRGPAVAGFARTNAEDVTRIAWQQWLADRQLAAAAGAMRGMRVGLYRDLAVGSDAAGAETWAGRDSVVEGLAVGAPPDAFSAGGQEWGLPPPHPARLYSSAYRSFVELLRANMRHAGALRIDHVMALERLYVIPKGAKAADGAYLDYRFEDLVGLVALESARQRCTIIGEDLGWVPPGFRERLADANVLSYRVLRWQRDGRRFLRPQEYPRLAVAVVGNHDLATLKAWWEGTDLVLDREQGALPDDAALHAARADRKAERDALLELLHAEDLLPGWIADPSYEELCTAVHGLLGRTRALLTLTQLDDVLREQLPVNAPGAPGYPSWRRRYGASLERLTREPLLDAALPARAARDGGGARKVS